jgi:hypothetical protein
MNRREFMATAAVACFATRCAIAAGQPGVVLFDARYGVSSSHAIALSEDGLLALPTNQDVVQLWYENRAFRTAAAVAGLTPQSDFQIVKHLLKHKKVVSFRPVLAKDRPASLVSWQFA